MAAPGPTKSIDPCAEPTLSSLTIGGADPVVAEPLQIPVNAPIAEVRRVVADRGDNSQATVHKDGQ